MKYFMADLLNCPTCGHFPLFFHPKKAEKSPDVTITRKPCDKVCRYTGRNIKQIDLEICKNCISINIIEGDLICNECGRMYPIIEGIPRLSVNAKQLIKRPTISIFHRYAQKYDNWFSNPKNKNLFLNELTTIRELIDFSLFSKTLEIGVGTGRFASELNIKFGVDPAFNSLRIAYQRKIFTVEGIAERLPFRDDAFDAALMAFTICYIKDPIETMCEAHRILKKGGKFVICFIDREKTWGQFYLERKKNGNLFYESATFYSEEEIAKLLVKNGFSIIDKRYSLAQSPNIENISVEKPTKKNSKDASFVCILAEK